ncbi:MAG: DNA-binding protein [Bacteroidetes bacterium]|nr:MAG: DNA-binding protein [Bacteroidota bacterium]
MQRIILLFCSLFLCLSSIYSQDTIKLEDAKNKVGDSVTVCGKVFNARFVSNATNEPTFLNIGAAYPNQLLTVVIWGDIRKQFNGNPEDIFLNKEICITGKIELYKEKPQIVIKNKSQISCSNCN